MKCKYVLDNMPLYLLDELSPAEARDIKRHLETCLTCQAELDSYSNIMKIITADSHESLSGMKKLELENSIYKINLSRSKNVEFKKNMFGYLLKAAAVLVIFFIGYFSGSIATDLVPNQSNLSYYQNNLNKAEIYRAQSSMLRFTSDGLKIIAHGKSKLKIN